MRTIRNSKRYNLITFVLCISICSLFYYHSTTRCLVMDYSNRFADRITSKTFISCKTGNNDRASDAISDRNYEFLKVFFITDSFNRTSLNMRNYREISVKDNIYSNLNLIIAGINDTVQNIVTVSFMLAIILMSFVSFLIALLKYIQKMDGKKRIVTFIR